MKLFKSLFDVFIPSLVVLIHFVENLKYATNPDNALLAYMRLYKWLRWSNNCDSKCV
eukprot:UN00700